MTRVIFCVIVESFPKEILSKYLEDLKQKKILNLFFLAWFAYTVGLKIRKKCKYFKIFFLVKLPIKESAEWGKMQKKILLEPNNLLSLCQIHQNFSSGVNLPKTIRVVPSKMLN